MGDHDQRDSSDQSNLKSVNPDRQNVEEIPLHGSNMDEWQRAKQGLVLFLNNEPQQAEEFLKQWINSSVHVLTSFTFINCINGVISYELEKLETAQRMLKDLELRCTNNNASWFQSVRSMLFGGAADSMGQPQTLLERLDEQIILADTQLCSAILTFLTQDMSGMMRGCWSLKKAWKIYQCAYKQIYQLYRDSVGEDDLLHLNFLPKLNSNVIRHSNSSVYSNSDGSITSNASSDSTHLTQPSFTVAPRKGIVQSFSEFFLSGDSSTAPAMKKKKLRRKSKNAVPRSKSAGPGQFMNAPADSSAYEKIDPKVVKRLHGAICFGYGVFQLSVSLLPPSMLKLVSFFGFEGDREMGLTCLKLCRETTDMRSPLATVALLWYHTIGTQIFAGEKDHWEAEIQEVSTILQESEAEFGESALFVFFKGRLERMRKKMPEAIHQFERAYYTSPLPELRLLCLHEIGWCRLIQLDCVNAIDEFHALQINSDYTKSFFMYLTTICHGFAGNKEPIITLKEETLEAISCSVQKESQLDQFLLQRVQLFPSTDEGMEKLDSIFWRFLVYELLFLWNSLDTCSSETLDKIVSDCQLPQREQPIIGLAQLILACCETYRGNVDGAQRAYRSCLSHRRACDEVPNAKFTHISAFASYKLAMLLINHFGQRDEAHALLLSAQQKFKGYDFESRLSLRIHTAIKELNM